MASDQVPDELWEEFHRVVNMTSRELADWLMVAVADEAAERFLDEDGHDTGKKVLNILGKRRTDLTGDDAATMERVVRRVHGERRDDLEPTAGQGPWRHKLMTLGHDPLKPAG